MELYKHIMFWDDGGDPPVEPKVEDGGDAGGKKKKEEPADKTYSEGEMKKSIDRRQAALKRARKAEENLKALKDKVAGMPAADEYDSLKTSHDAMKAKMKDLEEKQAEAELQKIEDEIERERVRLNQKFDKERAQMNTELQTVQAEVEKFKAEKALYNENLKAMRKETLRGEILSVASAKAYNAQQIVRLTADEFVYDEEDGRWIKEVYDSAGKLREMLTVEDFINSFLDDEQNENLRKANVKSGSDMPRTQKQGRDTEPPVGKAPTEAMYKWADMSGLNINKKSAADDKAWLFDTYMRLHKKEVKKAE